MNASLLRRLLPKPSGLTKKFALWSVAVLSVAAGHQAFATSNSWAGNAGSLNWNDAANWGTGTGPVPGASSGTTNGDTATFATATTSATTIALGTGTWNIKTLNIGVQSAASNSQPITFGSGGANHETLLLTANGFLTINATNNNVNQAIDATLSLAGSYQIQQKGGGTTTLTINGNINMGVGGAGTFDFNGSNTNNNTVTGIIGDGAGTLSITKGANSRWYLSGINTYTGSTGVNSGLLQAASTQAFGINSAVNLTPAVGSANGTLALNGFSNTIGSLASTTNGGTYAGTVTLGTATLTISGVNATPVDFAGVISGTGGSLVKNGSGSQGFSGANIYTGGTTVNAGTLLINGTNTGSAVTVSNANTILGGTGTITPGASHALTVNTGAFLAPGVSGSTGTLTVALNNTGDSATFASGAKFAFDLNAPGTSDVLAFTGLTSSVHDVAFNSNVVNFNNLGGLATGTYTLFTFDQNNAYTGILTIGTGLESFATSSLSYNANSIVLNVVPEPATWALLAAGLTVVVTFRRRRSA